MCLLFGKDIIFICEQNIEKLFYELYLNGRISMLNNIGLPGILLIAVVVLVLFGRGKISGLMGEVGKGITSFKKGISEGKAELEKAEEEAVSEVKDVTPEKDKS